MADTAHMQNETALDRSFDLTRVSWWTVGGASIVLVAALLRLIVPDWIALSSNEAERSLQALSLYDGRPLTGMELPDTAPSHLIGQALSFFLFGVTDASARLVTALAGVLIVILSLGLAPFVGRTAAFGMGIAATFSPILLYQSRVANPETLVAAFTMIALLSFLKAGQRWQHGESSTAWMVTTGFGIGGMVASGPSSLTVLVAIAVGLALAGLAEQGEPGPVRQSVHAFGGRPLNWLVLLASLVVTVVVFFSRGLSSLSSLSGIGETIGDWVKLLTDESSATPTQFFLLALLLYEIVFVLSSVAGFASGVFDRPGRLGSVFFLGWFVTALLMFSFSAGRMPEHAIHVALPVVLMGGGSAASIVAGLGWSNGRWKSSGLLLLVVAGAIASLVAFIVALDGASSASDSGRATFEVFAVVAIGVVPLTIASAILLRERFAMTGEPRWSTLGAIVVTALLVFLGAYTIRSSTYLSYYRADTSLELVAQRTSPPSVQALVRQINNLSRDLTLLQPTVQDPTGGHGIVIAIESDVDFPYRWYFREYPELSVVEPGTAVTTGADLVISRDSTGMDTSGYTPRVSASRNRIPPQYLTPSFSSVLESVFFPARWSEGMDFLLYRQGITQPDPESVILGYGPRLSQQLFTSTGPYALNERVGTGAGRGQFNQPRGIAVNSGDGSIYVVDSANGRVQKFDASGSFSGAWGGPDSTVSFQVTAEGLGPTGIEVSFDGLILVADTWNHRVVVLNNDGQVVREFGSFGDTLDAQVATDLPGQFFGPRDIATTANEIYVVDTGNERVQVFTPDGTFVRAWGGHGSDPSQFIEPVGIAVGPDDRVYVADSGNARISVFARDGTPLAQWPVEAWQVQAYFEPYLAFDQYGTLYATSSGTGTVEMFDIEGNYLGSLVTAGSESMETPIGIALAIDNTMRVTDRSVSAVMAIPIEIPPELPFDDATPLAGTPEAVDSPAAASPIASPASLTVAAAPEATPLVESPGASPLAASPIASPMASPLASPIASPDATPTP